MKILIISDLTSKQINGVVTTFQNTIKELKSRDYEVNEINADMFRSLPCPGYREIRLSSVTPKIIGQHIENFNPDYIHIATEGPIGLAARSYLRSIGDKWSSSFHTKFAEFVEAKIGFGANLIWKFLKWAYRDDAFILTTTSSMRDELVSHGFNRERIRTWSRGVDPDIFVPNPFGQKDLIFLNVGRVSVEKGLEDFYKLNLPGHKIQVGEGPELEKYKKKYPDVEFVGAKRGKELAAYYRNASVMVFPSRADTFGVVIIESMRCGTPVAAYPVTGPIDIIQNGKNGFMSENLSDAIDECLKIDRKKVLFNSNQYNWKDATDKFVKALIRRK
ncbi:MAG: glycosyltransferase family 1 protein [Gammaproteobacteria bacterium]|nr:glycosyltransferase family 1 protein [Gammaproteobacteria bacterium]